MNRAEFIRASLFESPSTINELAALRDEGLQVIRAAVETLIRQGHVVASGREVPARRGQYAKLYALTAVGRKAAKESGKKIELE